MSSASDSSPVRLSALYALSRLRNSVLAGTFSFLRMAVISADVSGSFLYSLYSCLIFFSCSRATALRQVPQLLVQIRVIIFSPVMVCHISSPKQISTAYT